MTLPDPQATLQALGQPSAPCTPVSGGADTLIWRVELPDGPRALRVFRPEQAPVAATEARVMSWLSAQGFPVPTVRALGEHGGRPTLLMDWVDGETLDEALRAQPAQATALGAVFGHVQARLHGIELPSAFTELAETTGGIVGVPGTTAPARLSILHLDYHLRNVLVRQGEVVGLIDWANVRLGDPRADVARSLAMLSVHPAFYGLRGPERLGLLAFRRAYLEAYTKRLALRDMAPFMAWAGNYLRADLDGRLDPADLLRIGRWAALWRG